MLENTLSNQFAGFFIFDFDLLIVIPAVHLYIVLVTFAVLDIRLSLLIYSLRFCHQVQCFLFKVEWLLRQFLNS